MYNNSEKERRAAARERESFNRSAVLMTLAALGGSLSLVFFLPHFASFSISPLACCVPFPYFFACFTHIPPAKGASIYSIYKHHVQLGWSLAAKNFSLYHRLLPDGSKCQKSI